MREVKLPVHTIVVPVITPLGQVISWLVPVYPVVHVCVQAGPSVTNPLHSVPIPAPVGIFGHTSAYT